MQICLVEVFLTVVCDVCLWLHRYVIDSGRHEEMRYDHNRGMSCLEDSWISKANARQRWGHEGRVHPGCCLRLFNREQFQKLDEQQLPEMLWVSLEGLCLRVSHLPTCGVPFSQFPLPLILLQYFCMVGGLFSCSEMQLSWRSVVDLVYVGLSLVQTAQLVLDHKREVKVRSDAHPLVVGCWW
jgi:hypothetical protein